MEMNTLKGEDNRLVTNFWGSSCVVRKTPAFVQGDQRSARGCRMPPLARHRCAGALPPDVGRRDLAESALLILRHDCGRVRRKMIISAVKGHPRLVIRLMKDED